MKNVRNMYLPLLIGIVATCWLLPSLGNGMLWNDEAQTALLARTTARYGVPIAFDGPNSISQEQGDDYGYHNLWKWLMWLPFYVLAFFFKLFGESTTIARLPFALFGVATVVLSYFTSLRLWRDAKSAVLTAVLVMACIPFVLLVRQCRYYSPSMFFSLLVLDAYLRICDGSRRGWILLAIAATLLFNSHFIYVFSTFAALGIHAAIWHRDKCKPLLLAGFTAGILCLPPALWVSTLSYRNYQRVHSWSFFWQQIRAYTRLIFTQILPYPVLLIPVFAGIKLSIQRRRIFPSMTSLAPWALPTLLAVTTLLTLSPVTSWPFFRYLGPVIVPLLMVVARWIVVAFRTNLIFGLAGVVFLALWWPESDYVYELTHSFVGPLEGIVPFLNANGKPGDVVVTSYEDMSIKFYCPFTVYGGLGGEDLNAARGARWLILRPLATDAMRAFIKDQVKQNQNYHPIILNVPDTEWENREEPADHLFRTDTNAPRVVVYELQHG